MIPKLGDPTVYPLFDAIECVVTRDVDGTYELDLTIPMKTLQEKYYYFYLGQIIKAAPNKNQDAQNFLITDIHKALGEQCTIHAVHSSYLYNSLMLDPWRLLQPVTSIYAFQLIEQHVVSDDKIQTPVFSYVWGETWTDTLRDLKKPTALRPFLLGPLLDDFGGMIDFVGDTVVWKPRIGEDRGASVIYGANMLSLSISEVATDYVTGIYPFYGELGGDKPFTTLTNPIIHRRGSYEYPENVYPLDLTSEFFATPTEQQLQDAAMTKAQKLFVDPPKELEFSLIPRDQEKDIRLDDDILVRCGPLGESEKRRIRRLEFDVLRERVQKITVGNVIPTLADNIIGTGGIIQL